jgi:hypothetical protein
VKRFVILTLCILALAFPATAQVYIEGNASSSETNVYDSVGTKTALKVGTSSVGVDGSFTTGGFDAFFTSDLILCGQQANNGTIYGGPALGILDGTGTDSSIGGTACDALDSATEATADAPVGITTGGTIKIYGMVCEVSSSGSNGVTLTARSGAADLSTSMTCTIAAGATGCVDMLASPVAIASTATVAMKVVNTEDLSTGDFWCRWFVGFTE